MRNKYSRKEVYDMESFFEYADKHPLSATILGVCFIGLSVYALHCNVPMRTELFDIGYFPDNQIEQY